MSAHGMALLLEGDAMNVDGAIQGMQGMQDIQAMQDVGGMGSAMALDEVDLFGDPVMDNALAGLPPRPLPSKLLLQRLDELRSSGCCQGIAWSRQGTIASITKDGLSVELRFLRFSPDTCKWELSEPSSWSPASQNPSLAAPSSDAPLPPPPTSAPFVHLAWSPVPSHPELAVLDALGRVTLLTFASHLNRPHSVRRWDTDAVGDLHAVAGCYWLPLGVPPNKQNKPFLVINGPATRRQSEYMYEHHFYPASGPWHPNYAKSALLCVTTNGALKLCYSQNNGRLELTELELESVTSFDERITHASLCSDRQSLLLALVTASKQLRVVRATVSWGLPQVDKQVPVGTVQLRPSMKETHVAVTSWAPHGPGEPALDAGAAQLSHLEILPSASETPSQPPAPPVVLAVRSYVPQDASAYHQGSQSIIDRWEVVNDQVQPLSPAFEQLGSKNGAASAPPNMTRLRKLDPIVIPKVVVAVNKIQCDRVLCFAFSDGTVQYRDRFTMNEVYHEPNTNSIMSPLQVGFQYTNETPCLQVAFSPTNCSFAQVCEDWTVKWNRLHYPMEDPNTPLQGDQQRAVLAALSVAVAAAGTNQLTCDDILAAARPLVQSPDLAYAWIREIVTALRVVVDYSEEAHHDQLVRNMQLQLCLSILNHLSFNGDYKPRSFGGKFAMLTLNLRNVVIIISIATTTAQQYKEKLNPLDDPEVVDLLTRCSKWTADLLSWLADSLFDLLDDPEFMATLATPKRFPEMTNHLRSKNNIALHLLLCSSTRGFLSAVCRRLMHIDQLSQRTTQFLEARAHQQHQDPAAATAAWQHAATYQLYLRMGRAVTSSPVKVAEFDRLLTGLSKDIQTAYQKTFTGLVAAQLKAKQGNLTEQQQQQLNEQFIKKAQTQCELDMLLAKTPIPSFREVLARFFLQTLPAFRIQMDPAKVYFADYSLLEVGYDDRTLAMRKDAGRYVDVFKRVELVRGPRGKQVNGAADGGNTVVPAKRRAGGEEVSSGGGSGSENSREWRRCVRCGAVMADMPPNQRPGIMFVLSQQKKCACGGGFGVSPRELA
ncbi:hypothetical protein VTI74DRAFT_3567 [Chaetomium olivicolor]